MKNVTEKIVCLQMFNEILIRRVSYLQEEGESNCDVLDKVFNMFKQDGVERVWFEGSFPQPSCLCL